MSYRRRGVAASSPRQAVGPGRRRRRRTEPTPARPVRRPLESPTYLRAPPSSNSVFLPSPNFTEGPAVHLLFAAGGSLFSSVAAAMPMISAQLRISVHCRLLASARCVLAKDTKAGPTVFLPGNHSPNIQIIMSLEVVDERNRGVFH